MTPAQRSASAPRSGRADSGVDAARLFRLARRRGLVLLENIMFLHHVQHHRVAELLAGGSWARSGPSAPPSPSRPARRATPATTRRSAAARCKKLVLATANPPIADLFDQQVPGNAWRVKPSWYIVGTQDRTVNPDRERASAERMKATTVSLDSSHVAMLSQPNAVLEVIRNAAKTLE
ncbi:alpha/beta fold hydrolase [Streptomyces sp. NPDC001848]|uniref:alpha/beta fold hydrolase n=1 Tax=Streptomyces sp. NPDC001848 TaxID=3364618 RepID=UPI003673C8B5